MDANNNSLPTSPSPSGDFDKWATGGGLREVNQINIDTSIPRPLAVVAPVQGQ
jgi:hypothetical protein